MATTLDITDYGRFDLQLRHDASRINRAGLEAKYGDEAFSAWLDASAFLGRSLAVGSPYSPYDEWQSTMSVSGIDYSLGASVGVPLSRSCLKVEWRNAWYAADVSTADPPFLGRAVAATASAYLPSGLAGLELLALYSLDDGSWLLEPSIEFEPVKGRVLSLGLVYFGGGSVTELGRFSASNSVKLALAVSI